MVWPEDVIQKVWEKGKVIWGNDQNEWRMDECRAWMARHEYGNRRSQYGWEIDHICPGGGDHLSNLRPLQWQNNVAKSNGRLKCNVTAAGAINMQKWLL